MSKFLDHLIVIIASILIVHGFDILVLSFVFWGEDFEKLWNISTWESSSRFVFLLWWAWGYIMYMGLSSTLRFYPFGRKK